MAMDQTIKQRLIGAIVLVALAIIFLPGILGQKKQQSEFSSQIPKKPETLKRQLNLSNNQSVNNTASTSTSEAALTNANGSVAKLENEKPSSSDKAATKTSHPSSSSTEPPADSDSRTQTTAAVDTNAADQAKPKPKPPVSDETTTETTAPKADSKSVKTLTSDSWLVQVGSFSSNDNANALVKKLESNHLKAFARPATLGNGKVLYRVYVGPWLEKNQAEQRLGKIRTITKLNPIVIAWDPTKH